MGIRTGAELVNTRVIAPQDDPTGQLGLGEDGGGMEQELQAVIASLAKQAMRSSANGEGGGSGSLSTDNPAMQSFERLAQTSGQAGGLPLNGNPPAGQQSFLPEQAAGPQILTKTPASLPLNQGIVNRTPVQTRGAAGQSAFSDAPPVRAGNTIGVPRANTGLVNRIPLRNTQTSATAAPAQKYSSDPKEQDAAVQRSTEGEDGMPAGATQAGQSRVKALSVLERYKDDFKKPKSSKDIQKMIDDDKTPPDLREALRTVQSDPKMSQMLDSAKNGKSDGKFSNKDISTLAQDPEVIQYNRAQAKSFTDNYIPSDDGGKTQEGRAITANDAQRELYRYSDYLPKNVSQKDLQDIVDGTGKEGKAPPQLVASAQYYLDHPDEWKGLTGKEGDQSISRGHLEDAIGKNVMLNADETKTVQTLQNNQDVFFGKGSLTRKKLDSIAEDSGNSQEVRDAAKQLSKDPMLFGMLDNGKHGNTGSAWNAADDGKIGKGDLSAFTGKMNKTVAPTYKTHPAATAQDQSAVSAMASGEMNQPDTKKKKGGQLRDFVNGLLKVVSVIEGIASKVLSGIASLKIPGISQIAGLAAMGTSAISGAANVGSTALSGGDVEHAGKKAAIDLGMTGISSIAGPGAGKAISEAGKEVGKEIGKAAAKGGAKGAAGQAVGQGMQEHHNA